MTAADAFAGMLAVELVDRTLYELAAAIRQEINVRECEKGRSRDIDEGIKALRWCLELVESA